MSRIVLIGGGSSSGKSYITEAVTKNVGENNITRITMDDYYKDQSDMKLEDRYKVNYDHPKAFDFPLMRKQIADLKNDIPIEKPIYDFVSLTRTKNSETIYPNKVVLVEGIMALVDKQIRNLGDIKVFISASSERRFLRRLIRDKKQRGRSFENIVNQYFSSVQPMYQEIVEPSSIYADLIVNNDGVENLAIAVLTSIIKEELELSRTKQKPRLMEEEFSEENLSSIFSK
ncbi:MAG TPA: uridine kinase [Firmicutes bacterium]|mgnify:CR=1 FL=1|nr:uridine kinase [Bacillota bacterium]HBM70279.1 uridine kinase [Bacillota bacterium]HBX25166.1 uridine kinase [Bacillota bacterium]